MNIYKVSEFKLKRTLITSALPYANGYLHLGHISGAYLPADMYARFLRISGEEVLYVCGSDEHGVAINISADKEKVSPQAIIDKYHFANNDAFDKFGMSFDIYSRTSLPEHHETAREFFAQALNLGYLNEKEEEQFYDTQANMFLPDRYVEGICPNCGSDKARGDQCDNCGAYYNQTELKNPISIISGKTPVVKKTTHWYYKFDLFQKFLEDYIAENESNWKDNVVQQTKSWLKAGLAERAITRDLNWGVSVSGINGIDDEKAKGKVIYVWFDAVLGYITATKLWAKSHNQNWEKWWKDKDTNYIAFIGKDNIVFHTIIFPAILQGVGEYNLPKNVPANEFLNLEGQKFSKSRNWSIDLKDFFEDFKETQYVDILRYTLAMNFPETKDADFTWKDFQARANNELAAVYGNFVNRTLQFLHKSFEGKVPDISIEFPDIEKDWTELTDNLENVEIRNKFSVKYGENLLNLLTTLRWGILLVSTNYRKFKLRDALLETMNIARASNKYFNDEEPWKTFKSDKSKAAVTLYVCCQIVRSLSLLFAPILPYTSKKINDILGFEQTTGTPNESSEINYWFEASYPKLQVNHFIKQPEILFNRIEDDVIQNQISKLGDKTQNEVKDESNLIAIEDFQKISLKTAKVISAEKMPKSKKLLKLQIQIGDEKRQILAGVAEYYQPDYLVGKIIVVVANLKPAKLMGEESQGMMLAASIDGKLCFVTPESKEIEDNAVVK